MVETREYKPADLTAMTGHLERRGGGGVAFPQEDMLTPQSAAAFFGAQSRTGVAIDGDEVVGLYILHPNNVGRCGHIANASYAVKMNQRGKRVGETLVRDSMAQAARLGFRLLQFNAVVAGNEAAIHLYKKIGFTQLGAIPGGFRLPNGTYADIYPFYIELGAVYC